jgi:hypothetical protein
MNPFARKESPKDDNRFNGFFEENQRIDSIHREMKDESAYQRAGDTDHPNGKQFHEHRVARIAAGAQRTDEQHKVKYPQLGRK